jgi:hypothetical protein
MPWKAFLIRCGKNKNIHRSIELGNTFVPAGKWITHKKWNSLCLILQNPLAIAGKWANPSKLSNYL